MIKEIRYKNWKSFKDTVLYIDPLTILIGTNASGKSNALDGLAFLNGITKWTDLQNVLNGDSTASGIRGGAEWASLKPETGFTLEVLLEYDGSEYEYCIGVSTLPVVELKSESLVQRNAGGENKILFATRPDPRNGDDYLNISLYSKKTKEKTRLTSISFQKRRSALNAVKELVSFGVSDEFVSGITGVVNELEKIFVLDPIPSLMRNYSSFSQSLQKDAANLAGVLAALPLEQKEKIEETLSNYVSQLPEKDIRKVWAEPVGRLKKDAMLYCEEEWRPGEPPLIVDAEGMSDGTLRFLAILTALLTRPEGSLIVIEEVDNGLHPSRVGLLLKMLREIGEQRKIDVLVTTHNPALLDELGPEMVPFVVVSHRSQETGESQLTLLEDIQNLPKLLATGPLGKIASQGELEKSLSEKAEPKDE